MASVELVFRTIGERTSDVALELAVEHLEPERVHVIDDVRPFSAAIEKMLRLRHDADYVVYVDADCLILEDMRAWVDRERDPYVDCYVSDRFRGRIHCGVHITRSDVVRKMAEVEPPAGDLRYELRPESRLRNLALRELGLRKSFRNFDILHDHFQYYRDVFAKYALRELRSRVPRQRRKLDASMAVWPAGEAEIEVARRAVGYARRTVPTDASAAEVGAFLAALPATAAAEMARLGIAEKGAFDRREIAQLRRCEGPSVFARARPRPKVFGLGLSRTGTRSLMAALQVLGFDVCHYPGDATTFEELAAADYDFQVLETHDGITDITVAPYYAQLDRLHPGSKFILTVRDKDSWLTSCRNHWHDRPAFAATSTPEEEVYMKVRRLLRAAVYGCYGFDAARFSWVYDLHVSNVEAYFAGRPESLLVLDVCGGDEWEPLCRFLGREVPARPFPHRGAKLSRRLRHLEPVAEPRR